MDKNAGKRLLASIGTILVILTSAGCNTNKMNVNKFFEDDVINNYEMEDKSLLTIDKAYKDIFFRTLPLINESYNKDYLKPLLEKYYLDTDFEGAYIFFNEYLKYLDEIGKNSNDERNIHYNLDFECQEYGYNMTFGFIKDNRSYRMNFANKDHILNHYDGVSQESISDNLVFKKEYYYNFMQLPGDKNADKDTAGYVISYSINYGNLSIFLYKNSTINEKNYEINTLDTTNNIQIYNNGQELYNKNIDDNLFNVYALELYEAYKNDLSVEDFLNSDFKINKHINEDKLVLSLK